MENDENEIIESDFSALSEDAISAKKEADRDLENSIQAAYENALVAPKKEKFAVCKTCPMPRVCCAGPGQCMKQSQ